MLFNQRVRIAALALERKLPTMFLWREALGLPIPQSVLLRADQVIE